MPKTETSEAVHRLRYKLLSSPPTAKTSTTVADISQNPLFAQSSVTSTPALVTEPARGDYVEKVGRDT